MKRVLILGCPGSGKSYFSKKLAEKTGLPLIHLDNIYWNKDKVSCSHEEFLEKIQPILKEDEWILDGNYHHSLVERMERCTEIFFLDIPFEECVKGIRNRIDVVRDDIPWVESEDDANELIDWIQSYKDNRPLELELIEQYPQIKVVTFKDRKEINAYLESL